MESVILHGGDDADAPCSVWKCDEGIVTDPSENRSAHTTAMIQDVSLTTVYLFLTASGTIFRPPKKYSEKHSWPFIAASVSSYHRMVLVRCEGMC